MCLSILSQISSVDSFLGSCFSQWPHSVEQSCHGTALYGIKGFRSWFESQFPDAILAMPKDTAHDEFDHVLIDMNQLLHVALRRSRSEGHALTLLMKELDACCDLASPRRSLVLAMDGPPSAAKLATQRRRRFSTIVRSDWKQQQLKRFGRTLSKTQEAKKLRRLNTETKTLCITPGTAFMDRAEQTLLYWAWQRMSNPRTRLSNVRVYISSSRVPGEGEVKLLDWILQKNRRGDSIAIIGGDSDLVLEGLIIPPSSTHNVFVLLPDGNKRYLAVSLWETTRALSKFLPKLVAADMMRVRTDLVLLLILNGNDYLPRLRGVSGFNKVFHTYLRLLHQWLDDKKAHPQTPFLVDPDTLEFNLPFCIAFFRHLSQLTQPRSFLDQTAESQDDRNARSRNSALGQLNNLVEGGFLPEPVRWQTVSPDNYEDVQDLADDEDDETAGEDDSSYDTDEVEADEDENNQPPKDQVLIRLTMGREGADDFLSYDLWQDVGVSRKETKQALAQMALEDLMGEDYSDEGDDDELGISGAGYAWEVQTAAPANVTSYLGGLLWNLQTYQDGICSDYAYNYGRRMAPSAPDMVDFFKAAADHKQTVGRHDLLDERFSHPISAGLSCLAALPSQVADLVPAPYNMVPNGTVEEFYAASISPLDNSFDMKRFESFCENYLKALGEDNAPPMSHGDALLQGKDAVHHGRRIMSGDHYWTVLTRSYRPLEHPFDPPQPFSERMSQLRPNRRLKVSRLLATALPRPRSVWSSEQSNSQVGTNTPAAKLSRRRLPAEVVHGTMGNVIRSTSKKTLVISDVEYKQAYQQFAKSRKKRKVKLDLTLPSLEGEKSTSKAKSKPATHKERRDFDVVARMREFKVVGPPSEPVKNVDGQTAIALLVQLSEAKILGPIEWNITAPSHTMYASVDPQVHECVRLSVKRGPKLHNTVPDDGLVYEQDRHVNLESRQSLKQHLASFALCDLLGPQTRWSEMTLRDLKECLNGVEDPRQGQS
jgi:hypothetical protein